MQIYHPLEEPTRRLEKRLRCRLGVMLDQFTAQPGCSIPQATETRNDLDAVYSFFANEHVSPATILACCQPATRAALEGCPRLLAIQDTSDFNFSSLAETDGLGYTAGATVRGLLLHSTLAVTPDGLPRGLLTQQLWTRDPADQGRATGRRQKAAPDKESYRWLDHAAAAHAVIPTGTTVIHVADREGDIYDWLAAPRPAHAHLLVRVAQAHRVVVHGAKGQTGPLSEVVRAQTPLGTQVLEVPRADDRPARPAVLTLRMVAVHVPPTRHAKKRSQLRSVPVWVIEALEESPPNGETPLCWRLVTTEAVTTLAETVRALAEYALRWRIERFHFVLKQGCQVEQLQLATAERLANALAVYSQVAVRLLRLTYLARRTPETPVAEECTDAEAAVLDRCRQKQENNLRARVRTVAEAVRVLARLGGHLGRKGDGPPGAKVLWRGLRRLHDQVLGFQMVQAQHDHSQNTAEPTDHSPSDNYP